MARGRRLRVLVAPAKRALKAIPLHDDPIMVLLPPDHALAHADHVPARTLAEEPFIQPRSRSMQEAEVCCATAE